MQIIIKNLLDLVEINLLELTVMEQKMDMNLNSKTMIVSQAMLLAFLVMHQASQIMFLAYWMMAVAFQGMWNSLIEIRKESQDFND